jgi:hypothetical protein
MICIQFFINNYKLLLFYLVAASYLMNKMIYLTFYRLLVKPRHKTGFNEIKLKM